MYRIDPSRKGVSKLAERQFKDLKIREREHLQEWIAANPEMLGEELLIIQKEFSGFDETNERLDLLALDKEGGLVIIENKLDDSGRDVVWQALKYTAYCSTLTTEQIVNIYQRYLNTQGEETDARDNLLDFLDRPEEDELLLNSGDQRIIFVANNFRKEVTATVLWLLGHDIQVQCFRAVPYSMGEELFLQIEQIIPLPETEEFMISIREKEKEENKQRSEGKARLLKFWQRLKDDLSAHGVDLFDRVSAKPYYYIDFRKDNAVFAICIGRDAFRVELYFPNDADKTHFDAMQRHQAEIKAAFDGEIVWQRLEKRKASRIKHEVPYDRFEGQFDTEENWDGLIAWARAAMPRFYGVVYPVWVEVQGEMVSSDKNPITLKKNSRVTG